MTTTPAFSVTSVIRPWLMCGLLLLILGTSIAGWLFPQQPSVTSKTIADIKEATLQMGRYANTVEQNTRAISALTESLTKEFNKREEESDNLTATLLQRYGYNIAGTPPGLLDPAGVLQQPIDERSRHLFAGPNGKSQDGLLPASYPSFPHRSYPGTYLDIDRTRHDAAESTQ